MSESIINQTQDRRIEDVHKRINNFWTIFIWVIGIGVIVGGIIINYSIGANNKADDAISQTHFSFH